MFQNGTFDTQLQMNCGQAQATSGLSESQFRCDGKGETPNHHGRPPLTIGRGVLAMVRRVPTEL